MVPGAPSTLDLNAHGTSGSESLEDADAALQAVLLASLSEVPGDGVPSEEVGSSQARAAELRICP